MVMYNHALFIYNQAAGQADTEKALMAVLPEISIHVKQLQIIQTEREGETTEICREWGERTDLVIILGGDGTVHEAINGLAELERRPVLGILPGGTCNDFSRMLRIPQNLTRAAKSLMQGKIQHLDVGKVNEHYFLNFWGVGLVAAASTNIDASQKKVLGKLSYFLSAMKTVQTAVPFGFTIQADGHQLDGEAVMILIMNGRYIGTNQVPFPNMKIDDGLLDVLIVRDSTFSSFIEVFNLEELPPNDKEARGNLHHFQASSLSVQTTPILEADTDGEIYSKTPAKLTVLPGHIRMIAGD